MKSVTLTPWSKGRVLRVSGKDALGVHAGRDEPDVDIHYRRSVDLSRRLDLLSNACSKEDSQRCS